MNDVTFAARSQARAICQVVRTAETKSKSNRRCGKPKTKLYQAVGPKTKLYQEIVAFGNYRDLQIKPWISRKLTTKLIWNFAIGLTIA